MVSIQDPFPDSFLDPVDDIVVEKLALRDLAIRQASLVLFKLILRYDELSTARGEW